MWGHVCRSNVIKRGCSVNCLLWLIYECVVVRCHTLTRVLHNDSFESFQTYAIWALGSEDFQWEK